MRLVQSRRGFVSSGLSEIRVPSNRAPPHVLRTGRILAHQPSPPCTKYTRPTISPKPVPDESPVWVHRLGAASACAPPQATNNPLPRFPRPPRRPLLIAERTTHAGAGAGARRLVRLPAWQLPNQLGRQSAPSPRAPPPRRGRAPRTYGSKRGCPKLTVC